MSVGFALGLFWTGLGVGVVLTMLANRPRRTVAQVTPAQVTPAQVTPTPATPAPAVPAQATPAKVTLGPGAPSTTLADQLSTSWEQAAPAGWVLGDGVQLASPTRPAAEPDRAIGWEQVPPAGWVLGAVQPSTAPGAPPPPPAATPNPPWTAAA